MNGMYLGGGVGLRREEGIEGQREEGIGDQREEGIEN